MILSKHIRKTNNTLVVDSMLGLCYYSPNNTGNNTMVTITIKTESDVEAQVMLNILETALENGELEEAFDVQVKDDSKGEE